MIAELAGIPEGHLSRLERGKRRLDKHSTIAALAAAADDLRDPAWSAIAAFSRVHALLPMGGYNQAYTLDARATDAARSVTGEVSGNLDHPRD